MLINVTLSIFNQFDLGNTTIEVTRTQSTNVFTFSHPANLIFPYTISLLIGFAIAILGSISFHRNGFAAQSNSFTQLLVTLTGSTILPRYTTMEGLPEDHDIPQKLKDLRIQFGKLVHIRSKDDAGIAHRVGFGVPEEIVTL